MPIMSVHFKSRKNIPENPASVYFLRIFRLSLLTSIFSLNKTFNSSSSIIKLRISSLLFR